MAQNDHFLEETFPTRRNLRQLGIKIQPRRLTLAETGGTPVADLWTSEDCDAIGLNARQKWFWKHQRGFLYCGNLSTKYPSYKCMLLQDNHKPHRSYVKKCVNSLEYEWIKAATEFGEWKTRPNTMHRRYHGQVPPQIRFSKLVDPLVEFSLPNETYFENLLAYEIYKDPAAGPDAQADQIGLYYDFCNGKSLRNLLEVMSNPRCRQILPESFIWHVTTELCYALVSLWTGWDRSWIMQRSLPGRGRSPPLAQWSTWPVVQGSEGWVPIVHRNITLDNVLLHFDLRTEKTWNKMDYSLLFPRVVLTNFSEANTINDSKDHWNLSRGIYPKTNNRYPTLPFKGRKPTVLEDIYAVGVILRRLVTFNDGVRDTGSLDYEIDDYPLDDYNQDSTTVGDYSYTADLIESLQLWEWGHSMSANIRPDFVERLLRSNNNSWTRIMRRRPKAMLQPEDILDNSFNFATAVERYIKTGNKAPQKNPREGDFVRFIIQRYQGEAGVHIQQVRVPLDFERMPWSPHSRNAEAAVKEIHIEMDHHRGTYEPIWLKWDKVFHVTPIPGEYRRLFGPPFNCGSCSQVGAHHVNDCDCDCVDDCVCGCHSTKTRPKKLSRADEYTDSEDEDEDPVSGGVDPSLRVRSRDPSPTLSETHLDKLQPFNHMDRNDPEDWNSEVDGEERRDAGPGDGGGDGGDEGDDDDYDDDNGGSDSTIRFSPTSSRYSPLSYPSPELNRDPRSPDSSRDGGGVFNSSELDEDEAEGGTPRTRQGPRTPFAWGVLSARQNDDDMRASGIKKGGGGTIPTLPRGDSSGDADDEASEESLAPKPLSLDPTPEELSNFAQGTISQYESQNPVGPPTVTTPFSQGVAMGRNHGVARFFLNRLRDGGAARSGGNNNQ
ncbi:hypothetical protein QBC38DRAFT_489869 [Podospora fimiseda]|uniref:Protein kinase domain-containing protein n=1 Tax=Podospora fimiseda TaxID=252190 RepID=A0AAN6YR71_9PEZI|nr:hypothetical protein QBC38DRAFT_489869 [Podospora fimiseda]